MKNICIILILALVGCRNSNSPNYTSKLQFTKPGNTFVDRKPISQPLANIEPAAGGQVSFMAKNNSHLNLQNYIYWQSEYYENQDLIP